MAYSLSASAASISKTRCQTPARAQREAMGVDDATIAKPRGQVGPRDVGPIAVDNRLNKQAVIACRDPNVAATTRQEILDAIPLVIPQGMAALCQRCTLRSFDGDGQGSLHGRGIGDTP
jgi:hypothetical protein